MDSVRSRLKTVLKVKKNMEKKAHGELVEVRKVKQREAERLDEMQNNNEAAMAMAGKTTKARATDLQAHRAFLQKLSKQIHEQKRKIQNIAHKEDAKRQVLIEKSQEKKVVEKLDERREAEELKELEKKYQSVIDMLAQRMRFEF